VSDGVYILFHFNILL